MDFLSPGVVGASLNPLIFDDLNALGLLSDPSLAAVGDPFGVRGFGRPFISRPFFRRFPFPFPFLFPFERRFISPLLLLTLLGLGNFGLFPLSLGRGSPFGFGFGGSDFDDVF